MTNDFDFIENRNIKEVFTLKAYHRGINININKII